MSPRRKPMRAMWWRAGFLRANGSAWPASAIWMTWRGRIPKDSRTGLTRRRRSVLVAFFEALPHMKGKWAKPIPGNPKATLLKLEPWQCLIICSLFGWLKTGSDLTAFSHCAGNDAQKKRQVSIWAARVSASTCWRPMTNTARKYSPARRPKNRRGKSFRPARLMALTIGRFP